MTIFCVNTEVGPNSIRLLGCLFIQIEDLIVKKTLYHRQRPVFHTKPPDIKQMPLHHEGSRPVMEQLPHSAAMKLSVLASPTLGLFFSSKKNFFIFKVEAFSIKATKNPYQL